MGVDPISLAAIAVAASAVSGGAAAYEGHEERKEQRRIAKKQQKEQERLQALEAGKTPEATEQAKTDRLRNAFRKNAIRKTILTSGVTGGSRLGD